MNQKPPVPRSAVILRWIARVWSALVFVFAALMIFSPDPNTSVEPVPLGDQFLLGLWMVSILGLFVSWRWEVVGAGITIFTMFLREIAFTIIRGFWMPSFLIIWLAILPPSIMFLAAWRLERKARPSSQGETQV